MKRTEDRGLKTEDRGRRPLQTVTLLRWLGVPREALYVRTRRTKANASFWGRGIDHESVLELAGRAYRAQARRWHPDKPGGCAERMAEIAAAWRTVKRRFKAKGIE